MELFTSVLKGIFALFLVLMYLGSIYDLYKAIQSIWWDKVKGELINASIAINKDYDGKTYESEILYSYFLEGVRYESGAIGHLGWFSLSKENASSIMDESISDDFYVYVNPKNKKESVIKIGLQKGHVLSIGYISLGTFIVIQSLLELIR
jgi:hypothetical protein